MSRRWHEATGKLGWHMGGLNDLLQVCALVAWHVFPEYNIAHTHDRGCKYQSLENGHECLFIEDALTLPKVENGENFCQIWTLFRRGFPPQKRQMCHGTLPQHFHWLSQRLQGCGSHAAFPEQVCLGVLGLGTLPRPCSLSWFYVDPFPGGQKMHEPLHLRWKTASRFSWFGHRALHPHLSESPSTMLVHLRCSTNLCPMSAPIKEWMRLAPSQPNSSGRHRRCL